LSLFQKAGSREAFLFRGINPLIQIYKGEFIMKNTFTYREIPYNYTSFTDKEIILKYFDEETWNLVNELRDKRITGRSAKLLFEIMGDIFIIDRNPYIFNDFLENPKKIRKLQRQHRMKLKFLEMAAHDRKVLDLIEKARVVDRRFFKSFDEEKHTRHKIHSAFSSVTASGNIQFSAYHKVAHMTDASDWRVEYPQVVLYPDTVDEIPGIIRVAKKFGLKIIPFGGATGTTGGVVPLFRNTAVVNTEKLIGIGEFETVVENGIEIPLIEVEAGAITENVIEHCTEHKYIFATDPTSAWASTIGGNISENAGGKKCVMWGTAIDNIYSYRIVNAAGETLEVRRRNHPYRKIVPGDEVIFDIYLVKKKGEPELVKSITLSSYDVRKKGVGKDVTNKALGGVPGLHKEGGDGIIISAKFVLYRPFKFCKTVCLEFFGNDLILASKAIVSILDSFEKNDKSYLTALEHFDEKYAVAINYRNKSHRSELPKAVLIIDIESNDEADMEASSKNIIEIVKQYNAEGFIAENAAMRTAFWDARKHVGAISRHTNAFKLNEDIVIPIEKLPEFSNFQEMINTRKELENYVDLVAEVKDYFDRKEVEDDTFLPTKISSFTRQLDEIREDFAKYIEYIEHPVREFYPADPEYSKDDRLVFMVIRDRQILKDLENRVKESFRQLFHGYEEIIRDITEIFRNRRSRKIIVATHMHAGDGNIHVNLPVHSNDYAMMQEAEDTVALVMKKTVELGGVITGEHGIGLTKLRFIDQDVLDAYAAYKKEADPDDMFNPGKLRSDFPLSRIYTPSFNLLGKEAFILEASDLGKLSSSIASCVRCGKCKPVCNTHYQKATMFYSPRNKILGISLIIEAVLYEAQTAPRLSFGNFTMLREIAEYCTGCHKCFKPCSVDIDFGEVTLAIKKLLVDRNRSKFKLATSVVLFYLKRRNAFINNVFRILFLKVGYSMQRLGYRLNRPFRGITRKVTPFVGGMLFAPMPKAGNRSLRQIFDLKGSDTFFAFRNPDSTVEKSVVYFPGCGSERMFPEISLATMALLYNSGLRVVIAPEFLCCGYPMLHNGKEKEARNKSYENRVVFHRMADTIGYMDIEDVVVSCGTCLEMLGKYSIGDIFPGAGLIDVSELIARDGLYTKQSDESMLYHDPCHTPLKILGINKTFEKLFGRKPKTIANCCGEGGTLAISTPNISNDLRAHKAENIHEAIGKSSRATVLTTCPSCVQGLTKIHGKLDVTGKHLLSTWLNSIWGGTGSVISSGE
jgi:FAD/FMN-containing dehydrogenase/Fe-S oxidoreductase